MLGLLRAISLILNLPGLGAGELRVLDVCEDASDLAGDGEARTGNSNLAGDAEFDGIVIGLSHGEAECGIADVLPAFRVDETDCIEGGKGGNRPPPLPPVALQLKFETRLPVVVLPVPVPAIEVVISPAPM